MVKARPPSHAARLLKTLVLAGASLGLSSCGGESRRTLDEGSGGNAGSSGSGTSGGVGAAAGMAAGGSAGGTIRNIETCSGAQRLCACTYRPPLSMSCTVAHPLGYQSDPTAYELASIDCRCDPARPAVPEDCAFTAQFTCAEYAPEYEQCLCYPEAPLTESDCKGRGQFKCAGVEPTLGCYCLARIG